MTRFAAVLSGALLLPSSAMIHSQKPHWTPKPKAHSAPAEVDVAKSYTGTFIPGTVVPMPSDYEDYTRGHKPWRLFEGDAPGERFAAPQPGPGLPTFDPRERENSKEVFMDASPKDVIGAKCAPGGDAAGHYFYNVWDPEVVPYIVPKSSRNFKPVSVVVAPGGGNIHLAWEAEGIAAAEWLNSIGVSAFVLKYRVPHNSSEVRIMDGQRAVILVRSKAKEYGLDPNKVGFMGSSAGGSLAVEVGMKTKVTYNETDSLDGQTSPHPNFLLLLYPGLSLNDFKKEGLELLPKVFLAYARDDPCCPAFITSILGKMAKVSSKEAVNVHEFPHGKHGWGSCDYYPQLKGLDNCNWHALAEDFLNEHVFGNKKR
eukprot:CAMPEP_0171171824 /NCGR_PEP_ID=MMETSP0790-20130122/9410_1 /TAXON_ID=2925 /ORGANISM="Alexandrium catenella, Strain OF101" /LENGTH=369 /DNA_ID=CAMNT_0011636677 /DNA_START=62 /DNA_END=1171 /DNA_ORIENTATION=-